MNRRERDRLRSCYVNCSSCNLNGNDVDSEDEAYCSSRVRSSKSKGLEKIRKAMGLRRGRRILSESSDFEEGPAKSPSPKRKKRSPGYMQNGESEANETIDAQNETTEDELKDFKEDKYGRANIRLLRNVSSHRVLDDVRRSERSRKSIYKTLEQSVFDNSLVETEKITSQKRKALRAGLTYDPPGGRNLRRLGEKDASRKASKPIRGIPRRPITRNTLAVKEERKAVPAEENSSVEEDLDESHSNDEDDGDEEVEDEEDEEDEDGEAQETETKEMTRRSNRGMNKSFRSSVNGISLSQNIGRNEEKPVANDDLYSRVKRDRRQVVRSCNLNPVHRKGKNDRKRGKDIKNIEENHNDRDNEDGDDVQDDDCDNDADDDGENEEEDDDDVGDDTDNDDDDDDDDDDDNDDDDDDDDEDEGDEDDDDDDEDDINGIGVRRRSKRRITRFKQEEKNRKYNLREVKPPRKMFEVSNEKRIRNSKKLFSSPARKLDVRRRTLHDGSSTTDSTSNSDDDEHFERRKKRSLDVSRSQCLPMNFTKNDLCGVLKDRQRIGASLADIDPMKVDQSITFESIGGLQDEIRALKEMMVFPFLYPEVFAHMKITPPRGVLFHGPPGTGKTLMARALANECSVQGRKMAFFMRKGADCLSKWVGESERQLRLLFDQAYQMRPSMIFFDEIDGLAPVRSSRQDQIHSSIVSTLLAIMDGLDSREEIIVIGATNRIDSIDPALRRPGRFDREFRFALPDVHARKDILKIHTLQWKPEPSDDFLSHLAKEATGYCGADLRALCSESSLLALRRRYPQIYFSKEKLKLDLDSITVNANDFRKAMKKMVAASKRSIVDFSCPLNDLIAPLLAAELNKAVQCLHSVFPSTLLPTAKLAVLDLSCDDDSDALDIHLPLKDCSTQSFFAKNHGSCVVHRPRLLLCGRPGQGQSCHLAPALLHKMEGLPVLPLSLPSLFSANVRTPEDACAQVFKEARCISPCIIYMPRVDEWWEVVYPSTQLTFLGLVKDLDPGLPILLLATAECDLKDLPHQVKSLFVGSNSSIFHISDPSEESRRDYFADLLLRQTIQPPPQHSQAARNLLQELPHAEIIAPRELSAEELTILRKQEDSILRELRLFLRDILNKIGRDRKYHLFAKPVDRDDAPDYYDIISQPMDLQTIMKKIDAHYYMSVKEFLDDIELIVSNALEYNPDTKAEDKLIRHRACSMRDHAFSLVETELDAEFEKRCQEVAAAKKLRNENPAETVPKYFHSQPPANRSGSYISRYTSSKLTPSVSKPKTGKAVEKGSPPRLVNGVYDKEPVNVRGLDKVPIRKKKRLVSPFCQTKRGKTRFLYFDKEGRKVWGNISAELLESYLPFKKKTKSLSPNKVSMDDKNPESNAARSRSYSPTTDIAKHSATAEGQSLEQQKSGAVNFGLTAEQVQQLKHQASAQRKEVILDKWMCEELLDKAVSMTRGFHVENIQQLYVKIAAIVAKYKTQTARTGMLEEIRTLLK